MKGDNPKAPNTPWLSAQEAPPLNQLKYDPLVTHPTLLSPGRPGRRQTRALEAA